MSMSEIRTEKADIYLNPPLVARGSEYIISS